MAPPWLSPISRLHPFPILKRRMAFHSSSFPEASEPSIPPTHTDALLPSTFALPSPGNLYPQLLLQDPAKGSLLCIAPTPGAWSTQSRPPVALSTDL